ncbi:MULTISPECIES: DeoR/GlpR family DNA-binding transcription regulator [unclassified Vibrio]|uniref:DeoR/GlpR family DNA-binding transcription regulator n=1 Tax=unclassified Vibrio TaxID=2614977 RepID=UPI0015E0F270|nr:MULTISPECIES: DeoR/GlpR family DNA-binding transcription regulator [unclassified Vibrio]MBD1556088.1 DeoR/GlpR transcriptional regulator [Vibrio sp. S9_S30]
MSRGDVSEETMLPEQRQSRILQIIRKNGVAKNAQLAKQFGVNIATIRRDFTTFEKQGLVTVVYGGAKLKSEYIAPSPYENEIALEEKQNIHLTTKQTIAQKAASLIKSNESIGLNAGSTVPMILDYLSDDVQHLSVTTLALNIAEKAVRLPIVDLFVPGGHYRNTSHALSGTVTEQALASINLDRGFFGASAIDLNAGWTHPAHAEVPSNQMMLRQARKKYLVCDSSKLGRINFSKVSDLAVFDAFIVDDEFPLEYRQWAEDNGIEVI